MNKRVQITVPTQKKRDVRLQTSEIILNQDVWVCSYEVFGECELDTNFGCLLFL